MTNRLYANIHLAGNEAMKQYFDSLPYHIQETMLQSGLNLKSQEELEQCARHLMDEH